MDPYDWLGSRVDGITEKIRRFAEKQYFRCPNPDCGKELVTLRGLVKETYVANVAAYAYLLDRSLDPAFAAAGIVMDELDEDFFSESVLEGAEEYVRSRDDFHFDPETMKCDHCGTNIKTGQQDLSKYVED